jgi:hypothetical protein
MEKKYEDLETALEAVYDRVEARWTSFFTPVYIISVYTKDVIETFDKELARALLDSGHSLLSRKPVNEIESRVITEDVIILNHWEAEWNKKNGYELSPRDYKHIFVTCGTNYYDREAEKRVTRGPFHISLQDNYKNPAEFKYELSLDDIVSDSKTKLKEQKNKEDNKASAKEDYKWYRIDFRHYPSLELTNYEREDLLAKIREAGLKDQYEVEFRVNERQEEFIQTMLWNQDTYRLQALLREAFHCDEGKEFDEHNLSRSQPPYRLIVYNNNKKIGGEEDE